MSLFSTPNKDGTTTLQVDYPYYLKWQRRKYWQRHNKETALEEAHRFGQWVENRVETVTHIVHNPERQHFLVIWEEQHRETR